MNVYTTDKIRNVVILGHGGAGKTSLVESMAEWSSSRLNEYVSPHPWDNAGLTRCQSYLR